MSYAADILLYYIKTLWEQADLRWNSDNQAEVKSIVESIESTIESQIKQKLQSTSMTIETSLYCSEDFLDKAVTVHDTRADSFLVWLVNFESKTATSGTPSMYERQEWKAFKAPTLEKFIEFLSVETAQVQNEEAKTSQEYIAMFADYQKQQLLQQTRQKIASEQLAAVVIADAAVWAKDANAWMSPDAMVKKAVGLTDLLLKELQDSTD